MTLPLAIIHATRPTGGLKIVAERTTIETRTRMASLCRLVRAAGAAFDDRPSVN